MPAKLRLITFISFLFITFSYAQKKKTDAEPKILRIEMNLSALGVESDDFPSIDAKIDFIKDTSSCVKSFYNPQIKGSTYSLTKKEMAEILKFIRIEDLEKLEKEYEVAATDQPSSKTKIVTSKKTYIVYDYGLEGAYPLKDLYLIVYKY